MGFEARWCLFRVTRAAFLGFLSRLITPHPCPPRPGTLIAQAQMNWQPAEPGSKASRGRLREWPSGHPYSILFQSTVDYRWRLFSRVYSLIKTWKRQIADLINVAPRWTTGGTLPRRLNPAASSRSKAKPSDRGTSIRPILRVPLARRMNNFESHLPAAQQTPGACL